MSRKKHPQTEIDPALIEEALEAVAPSAEKPAEPAGEKDKELNDRLLRLAADFDNFRKRTQKEKTEFVRYANENLVRDLLPILDNFERALGHATADEKGAVLEGVKLIFSQLTSTLARYGVRSESAVGKPFDPLVQEAVNHLVSRDHPANTVMEEHQKAYFLHDRLIRPALVSVSKGPETGETHPPGAATESEPESA
jgi:molecular chaperone GrpE